MLLSIYKNEASVLTSVGVFIAYVAASLERSRVKEERNGSLFAMGKYNFPYNRVNNISDIIFNSCGIFFYVVRNDLFRYPNLNSIFLKLQQWFRIFMYNRS